MEDFLESSLGKFLRWLFLLPLSFLSLIIVPILWNFFMYAANTEVGADETWLMYIFRNIISGGLASFCFVYIGSIIAPAYRKFVSIVLSTMIITLYIILFMGIIHYDLLWKNGNIEGVFNVLSYLIILAGAILGALTIYKEY